MKIQNHKMLTSCPGSEGDIARPVQLYRLENCQIPGWNKKKPPESHLMNWKCILALPDNQPGLQSSGAEPTKMIRPHILAPGLGRIRLNYTENVGYLNILIVRRHEKYGEL